jgi:hypothetical protein
VSEAGLGEPPENTTLNSGPQLKWIFYCAVPGILVSFFFSKSRAVEADIALALAVGVGVILMMAAWLAGWSRLELDPKGFTEISFGRRGEHVTWGDCTAFEKGSWKPDPRQRYRWENIAYDRYSNMLHGIKYEQKERLRSNYGASSDELIALMNSFRARAFARNDAGDEVATASASPERPKQLKLVSTRTGLLGAVAPIALLFAYAIYQSAPTMAASLAATLQWWAYAFLGLAVVLEVLIAVGRPRLALNEAGFTEEIILGSRSTRWADCSKFEVVKIDDSHEVVRYSGKNGVECRLPRGYGKSLQELAKLMNQFRDRALSGEIQ